MIILSKKMYSLLFVALLLLITSPYLAFASKLNNCSPEANLTVTIHIKDMEKNAGVEYGKEGVVCSVTLMRKKCHVDSGGGIRAGSYEASNRKVVSSNGGTYTYQGNIHYGSLYNTLADRFNVCCGNQLGSCQNLNSAAFSSGQAKTNFTCTPNGCMFMP